MNLERAIAIAVEAHAGQSDKAGAPYILHPLRVMLALSGEQERIVGVLHDVVEDGGPEWTFERLADEGFGHDILDALHLVTKRPEDEGKDDQTYFRFVRRTLGNPIARRVKMADIRDNLDVTRMPEVTERDRLRLNRYLAALEVLQTEA